MVGKFLVAVTVAVLVVPGVAQAAMPPLYHSCAHLNARYPHGVGKAHAHDHTTGTPRVTAFLHSDKLYALAMRYNRGLDRDHDGIACEQA